MKFLFLSLLFSLNAFSAQNSQNLTPQQRLQISQDLQISHPGFFQNMNLNLVDAVILDSEIMNGDDLECEHSPRAPYCLNQDLTNPAE